MVLMARKPNKSGGSRNIEPREAFHLPAELQLALEIYAATAEPPVGKSAVIRFALEKYLTQKGCYPPSAEQLQQLLTLKDRTDLSGHAQAYLKAKKLT